MFSKASNFVTRAFNPKYLLYTNMAISTSLSAIGDVIEQWYENFKGALNEWDPRRTINMSTTGTTNGALIHYWYGLLDKRLPGNTFASAMKKLALDQVVFTPIGIACFFVTIAVVEQLTFEQFEKEVRLKGWILYVSEWVGWPPAQFINFYFLPTRFRVLYDSTISLGYDVYRSYVKNSVPFKDDPSFRSVKFTKGN